MQNSYCHSVSPVQAYALNDVQVSEHDVQSLKEAAGLTRAEAVQSLCHTKGDLHAALRNELSSHHLSTAILDPMLREYMAYRQVAAFATSGPNTVAQQGIQWHEDHAACNLLAWSSCYLDLTCQRCHTLSAFTQPPRS